MAASQQSAGGTAGKTSEGKAVEIERVISPTLDALGFEIVRVQISGDRRARLQVMIERRDRTPVTIEGCSEVSRAIGALLDVEDAISNTYILEVSSPGIDRPLTRLRDFSRFAGFEAKVETEVAIGGRRRFRGRLLGVREEQVCLATDWGEVALPFAAIRKAKLVLTDELIAAHEAGQGPHGEGPSK